MCYFQWKASINENAAEHCEIRNIFEIDTDRLVEYSWLLLFVKYCF